MNERADELILDRIVNLSQNTDFTATLFESVIGYAIIAADFDGNILAYNEGARQIYGYDPGEVVGKQNIESFFPHDFLEAGYFQQAIDVFLGTGRFSYEGEKVRKNGSRFPAQILFTLTKDKTGKVVGFVEIVQDLTERKRVEEELRKAKEDAEGANRAKSAFLATMSHEIRTPMNGILGMTELALGTDLAPEPREYLEMVKASADALLTVINDILDFSKIEAGKLELDPIDFQLRDSLGDTMRSLALRAHAKGLELAYHVRPDVPDAVVGDPGRLRQVVMNLVGNALKFTERGEVVASVEVEAKADDAVRLHFAVRDTGIGIPPEKQRLLFNPFVQADSSTTRKYGGTGLGLAISARLVALMDGRIWLESAVGQGSTFHFIVRLGLQRRTPAAPQPLKALNLRGLPVLVVDDNATNRRILEEMLSNWHMQPTVADGGGVALTRLKQAAAAGQPFPLVLLDIMMPEMDGFTLAQLIKQDPALASAALITLSSSGQSGDAARGRELGVAASLMKPIKQSDLLEALGRVLGAPAPARDRPPPVVPAAAPGKRRLRLLLAEDNAVNQRLAVRLLEKQGHTVVVAGDGKQALAVLEQQSFDLVLMDVEMPEMGGFEATAAIRAREQETGRHLPIIAMTAHAMKGDRERCLAAGMDGYASKPLQPRELFEVIDNVAAGRDPGGPEGPGPSATGPVFNEAEALGRTGGDQELLRELMGVFLGEYPGWLAEIRRAIAQNDAATLKRAAHSLKGAVGHFGARAAGDAAQRLETMGRDANLAGASAACATLEQELNRLQSALADFVAQPSS